EGYAKPLVVKPNTKYRERFKECYKKALEEHKGLWKRGN
ncbi:MAG: thermonuclease, partial [Persephonella sp.]